jgi:hypothetical protein
VLPTNFVIDLGERMDAAGFHIGNSLLNGAKGIFLFSLPLSPESDELFRRLGSARRCDLNGKKLLENFSICRILGGHAHILPDAEN